MITTNRQHQRTTILLVMLYNNNVSQAVRTPCLYIIVICTTKTIRQRLGVKTVPPMIDFYCISQILNCVVMHLYVIPISFRFHFVDERSTIITIPSFSKTGYVVAKTKARPLAQKFQSACACNVRVVGANRNDFALMIDSKN